MMLGLSNSISSEAFSLTDSSVAPLLDGLPKPETAFFIPAQLWGDYTGAAIRVRRASDDVEIDINYVDGLLDETAIISHCGASIGYVVTAYDQSGNSNDWTQATASLQPLIFDGVNIIKNEGHPSFNSSESVAQQDSLNSSTLFTTTTGCITSIYHTARDTSCILSTANGSMYYGLTDPTTPGILSSGDSASTNFINSTSIGATRADLNTARINNTVIHTITNADLTAMWSQSTNYPNDTYKPVDFITGMLIYDSNQSSNRAAIESAINNYLGIY